MSHHPSLSHHPGVGGGSLYHPAAAGLPSPAQTLSKITSQFWGFDSLGRTAAAAAAGLLPGLGHHPAALDPAALLPHHAPPPHLSSLAAGFPLAAFPGLMGGAAGGLFKLPSSLVENGGGGGAAVPDPRPLFRFKTS
jgi:hypothetical protein